MTPSTTRQWPLSPSGMIHPERSSPLKRETHSPVSATFVAAAPVIRRRIIAVSVYPSEVVSHDLLFKKSFILFCYLRSILICCLIVAGQNSDHQVSLTTMLHFCFKDTTTTVALKEKVQHSCQRNLVI